MKTFVMIPTYNEAANIGPLVAEVRRELPEAHILVVDDSSPDGTAGIVEQLAQTDERLHCLVRAGPRGRGAAGREGLQRALDHGADRVIEMDADFSHHPRYLPALLAASEQADVVLGSRYMRGGREANRTLFRRLVTAGAGMFLRRALKVTVRDPSSGFRCFSRGILEAIKPDSLVSTNFSITPEILYKARLANARIVEVPIVFEDRTRGSSKLTWHMLIETLLLVGRLNRMHRAGKL